jgi:hypothetical protein
VASGISFAAATNAITQVNGNINNETTTTKATSHENGLLYCKRKSGSHQEKYYPLSQ